MAEVLFHEEDGSWWAESFRFPGCFAAGATFEECKAAWVEALAEWRAERVSA